MSIYGMKQTFILLVLSCIVLTACKKDSSKNKNVPVVDITGRYSLTHYRVTDSLHTFTNDYNSDDIPCMKNVKVTFISNGSIKEEFIGQDKCYLYYKDQFNNSYFSADTTTKISTWKKVGNDIVYTTTFPNRDPKKENNFTYKISSENGQVKLSSTYVTSFSGYYAETTLVFKKDINQP
jgi:hypothetical protein